MSGEHSNAGDDRIAVVGLSCRFPGARNPTEFWQNLREGVESITHFSDEELLASGIRQEVLDSGNYVKCLPVLRGIDQFDASFFAFSPADAEILDPQQRLLLELGWEAIEDAGYDSNTYDGAIGVWAGAPMSRYLMENLMGNASRNAALPGRSFQILLGNSPDTLTTQLSYKLNLRGPSMGVQTACSTGLVSTAQACQSLLEYQCDMALAGGISVLPPEVQGYHFGEGDVYSPDGHTRPFDTKASGTAFGHGGGLVLLKRYGDAIDACDQVYAVLRGWAVTNDGGARMFFTAPGVDGQVGAITTAQTVAGVEPESIDYIEAHGSASPLGDSIEAAALVRAFEDDPRVNGSCAIGSVKSNFGHLGWAAGIASLIKTVLAVRHGFIPPSLNCDEPNPDLGFDQGPFYINTELRAWKKATGLRRAGVNSAGMGGTNAHVIVEEAPSRVASGPSRSAQLLQLSARTPKALDENTSRLLDFLERERDVDFADIAHTLRVGRRAFRHRRVLVSRDREHAIASLRSADGAGLASGEASVPAPKLAFMFSGVGDVYEGMARELYEEEPTFRMHLDHCFELLTPMLGIDLRQIVYPLKQDDAPEAPLAGTIDLARMMGRGQQSSSPLDRTLHSQPAVFAVEYALARLLMEWGIRPDAMIGHSIGEYVAACLAGVFSLEDALSIVARRALLIEALPEGGLLAVLLSEEALEPRLAPDVWLAAVNATDLCVVSGTPDSLRAFASRLKKDRVVCRWIPSTHAFHSPLLKSIEASLTEIVSTVKLSPPQIPYVSNISGTWITAEQATDPHYWADHACKTVRFAEGAATLFEEDFRVLLEVGPGQSLSGFVSGQPTDGIPRTVLPSVRASYEISSDLEFLMSSIGKLWLTGLSPDWSAFKGDEIRHRVSLPTYSFDRQRYWVEPVSENASLNAPVPRLDEKAPFEQWFYAPVWTRAIAPIAAKQEIESGGTWLVFCDDGGLGSGVIAELEKRGATVVSVLPGDVGCDYANDGDGHIRFDLSCSDDYAVLLTDLEDEGKLPEVIVYLCGTADANEASIDVERRLADLGQREEFSFYQLMYLAHALADQGLSDRMQLLLVSAGSHDVVGDDAVAPEGALAHGLVNVLSVEQPNLICRTIDVAAASLGDSALPGRLIDEVSLAPSDALVAFRGDHRWVRSFDRVAVHRDRDESLAASCLRDRGVYLITGGLGAVGLSIARTLAERTRARLVLLGRSEFPDRWAWESILANSATHDGLRSQISRVAEIEALGSDVLIQSADVTDREQMQALVDTVTERFGTIHGVIHAAGVAGGGLVSLKTREVADQVLAPKVLGTLVLDEIFAGVSLDFFAVFSSVASLLPALGEGDYCAANAFLDSFAAWRNGQGRGRTVAINWGGWQSLNWGLWNQDDTSGTGASQYDALRDRAAAMQEKVGMSPEEGAAAFVEALGLGISQVVVTPQDLAVLLAASRSLNLDASLAELQLETTVYPRPALSNEYVAPSGKLETSIAEIWQELLRIDRVGIHDNFVELGGHSLVAMQVVNELCERLDFNAPLRSIFERPTVSALAELVASGGESNEFDAQDGEDESNDSVQGNDRDREINSAQVTAVV